MKFPFLSSWIKEYVSPLKISKCFHTSFVKTESNLSTNMSLETTVPKAIIAKKTLNIITSGNYWSHDNDVEIIACKPMLF